MASICWLASYPKSGNTWMRALLANYQADSDQPVDINHLDGYGASSRLMFDEWTGIEASALDAAAIDNLLPDVYRCEARDQSGTLFFKVHDMFRSNSAGAPLFPADVSSGAIYIVRHVLDVAISLAHHAGLDAAAAVRKLCDPANEAARSDQGLNDQLRQKTGSWSTHVSSWMDQSAIPLHLVRYEDLLRSPVEVFGQVVHFCGLPVDEDRVRQAVAFSSFEELRRQEQSGGFRERPEQASAPFFRRGRTGCGADELPAELVQHLLQTHGQILRRLNYVGAGEPENQTRRDTPWIYS